MPRVAPVSPEKAEGRIKDLFDKLSKSSGRVINIFQNMGNSTAVLEGYLNLNEAVNHTSLSPKLREQIALVVGQTNQCGYCLAIHTSIGGSLGLKPHEILKARQGAAEDQKTAEILKFAKEVVESRAKIADEAVDRLKKAGVSEQELIEIVMVIIINLFTNYFNLITETKIDFPESPKLELTSVKI